MVEWYMLALRRYVDFAGRSRRREYWFFALGNVIIAIVLMLIERMLGMASGGYGILTIIFELAILVPSIAVSIRRLHDTGRSGWWILIAFVPILGALVLLYFMLLDSEPGMNAYGPNPKEAGAVVA